nr:interleukin-1 receptor-associated kinase 1 [Nothobranchius furzeri]
MAGGFRREQFLFKLPSPVNWEFCRVMDGLSDLDWTRFASEVLKDQTAVRLAERQAQRTDWVMNQWGCRNGRVGELIDLLESLQLFRPRDVILTWTQAMNPSSFAPPPLPPPPPPPRLPSPPPYEQPTAYHSAVGGENLLPRPAPPPVSLYSKDQLQPQESRCDVIPLPLAAVASNSTAVICWAHEEVHAGTRGFSPALQIGEGGFGVVYRASLRGMDCAVKRIREVCMMDSSQLRRSFQTEVEKLSKFRHPNIIDLLGFSEGGGSMCLIYSFMENRALEDQLHKGHNFLSWPQRVSIAEGAASALQFLHSPPAGQEPLIHGDVKSSNILLDRHLVAKLSDFGLARCVPRPPSGCSVTQTASVGKTATVRGTLAYLPDEYVRKGELCTAVDVYSFGVVLLEVLTGRPASEQDRTYGEKFLKDLVEEVEDHPDGSSAEAWRKHLDRRLVAGGAAEPDGYLQVAALACRSLHRQRKKRPAMKEVFDKLHGLNNGVKKAQNPYRSFPTPPSSLDPSVEPCDSYAALTPPNRLLSSSLPLPSTSLAGPCETDESRGCSQYELRSQTSSGSQDHSVRRPPEHQCHQPSVPTEDQYNFPSQSSSISGPGAVATELSGFSPAGSLQSASPQPSVCLCPSQAPQNELDRTRTPELQSLPGFCGGTRSEELRGPEESDELDYLQDRTTEPQIKREFFSGPH